MKTQEIIFSYLQSKRMTIDQFVQIAGVGRTAFYDFRTGRKPVSLSFVNRLLKVCGYELIPMPIKNSPTTSPGGGQASEQGTPHE